MELVPPVMMAASIRSALVIRRGAGSGISIASLLTTPVLYGERLREGDCFWYCTRLVERRCCRGCLLRTPARISSSRVSLSRFRSGSSSSASCSAMSPVSVHEDSESSSE